jgi:CMP-N-acetylneuraminic acid synthetase
MLESNRILVVIPARGNSKRLPGKNLIPLGGKPLIEWTIDTALSTKGIDTVCVSTDDPAIQSLSVAVGAEAPFLRPAEYATDDATSASVVSHAIDYYCMKEGKNFEVVILLQPTSPLRRVVDIEGALALFMERKAANVVTVCETDHSPLWCNTLPPDLSFKGFIDEKIKHARSQDLPKFYRINGAIYIVQTRRFLTERELILDEDSFAYIMPKERSIDIDTGLDLQIAEKLLGFGEINY